MQRHSIVTKTVTHIAITIHQNNLLVYLFIYLLQAAIFHGLLIGI